MKRYSGRADVAVIGAGPAGMMAAIRAAQNGASVLLLERNPSAGRKLLMTGKERCNITHHEPDPRVFARHFGSSGKFLLPALFHFGATQTVAFFNQNGLPTQIERGDRVFPQSGRAQDVLELLLRLLRKDKVELLTNVHVQSFEITNRNIDKILLQNGEILAKNIIIATGGRSYPKTGATGDGYTWAGNFGHTIVEPVPALTPILVKEKYVADLEGLALKNVRITVIQNSRKQDDRFGEAFFMGNGLNGPIVLDISKKVGELLGSGDVTLLLDLKPALDFTKLDNRLIREFEKHNTQKIEKALSTLLPKKLIPVILKLADIGTDQPCNTISKKERKKLRRLLKELPFTVKSLVGFKKAVITAGGISLKEIDPQSMRSKIIDNLFFAGEIIDLDGPTGGYNLQECWSTGYVAGENAGKE